MVNGFPASPAFRMAVTGRQKLKWYFAFIQPMNESANPVQTIANSRAVSEVSRFRAAASPEMPGRTVWWYALSRTGQSRSAQQS